MAYPKVDAPYGFRPVGRVDGMPYAGAMRQYPIASGLAENIALGEPVKIVKGVLSTATAASTTGITGIFMGCEYTDPVTKQLIHSQVWPSGTVASDAVAYVVDDPMVLFRAAITTSGTDVTGVAYTAVGQNIKAKTSGTPSLTRQSSVVGLDSAGIATTSTHVFRVVDVVKESAYDDSGTLYQEVLVKINNHTLMATLSL